MWIEVTVDLYDGKPDPVLYACDKCGMVIAVIDTEVEACPLCSLLKHFHHFVEPGTTAIHLTSNPQFEGDHRYE